MLAALFWAAAIRLLPWPRNLWENAIIVAADAIIVAADSIIVAADAIIVAADAIIVAADAIISPRDAIIFVKEGISGVKLPNLGVMEATFAAAVPNFGAENAVFPTNPLALARRLLISVLRPGTLDFALRSWFFVKQAVLAGALNAIQPSQTNSLLYRLGHCLQAIIVDAARSDTLYSIQHCPTYNRGDAPRK